jgi:lipopolysaccharide heptosyltransferase II
LKILLIRLRQIGDVVFTTPAVAALKHRFPSAELTYVVEPAAAPVVADNPLLAEVVVAPPQQGVAGLLGDIRLGRALSRRGFDIAIDFHGGPRASLLTWLSGAPTRIGYSVTGRAWMYTDRVDRPRELRARHSVVNQWDLLIPLGVPAADPARFPVQMPVNAASSARVQQRLASAGVPPGARLVVLHVSAGNPFRRWPVESFGQVVAALVSHDPTMHVVVTSGPSEMEAASRVIALARAALGGAAGHRALDCGEFTLAELRALLERAALYIGGDSGPMHIAATTRVPMVSIYGPTLPARSAPWRSPELPVRALETNGLPCRPCDQRRCIPGDFRCLGRIAPADVIDACRHLLASTAG